MMEENEIESYYLVCSQLEAVVEYLYELFGSEWSYYAGAHFSDSVVFHKELYNSPYVIYYDVITKEYGHHPDPRQGQVKDLEEALLHVKKYIKLVKFI